MTYQTRHPRIGDVITDGENYARVYDEPEFVEPPQDDPADAWWRSQPGFENGWWRCEVSELESDVEGGEFWTWCGEDPVEVVDDG